MAIMEIVKYPDKRLHTPAERVQEVDRDIRRLIDDMAETMYFASGVGLAANQVGVFKRVAVIDVSYPQGESNLIVLVNPDIIEKTGATYSEEGCLSFPGVRVDIERASHIKIRALNRDGDVFELNTDGLLSTALQHEIDHLNGVLIIDRVSFLKKRLIHNQIVKRLKSRSAAALPD
jgi:peptide deformylase